MDTLCVISSGKKKIWDTCPRCGPQKAGNIYVGSYTQKCLAYAATFYPSSWCFLSPKYGFLMPDDVVYAPECAKFNLRQTFPLSMQQLAVQARTLKLDQYSTVTVLASRVYLDVLHGVFPQAYVKSPFTGAGGIGTMMGVLTAAIKTNTPLA